MFVIFQSIYTKKLRECIEGDIRPGLLPYSGNPVFYNYIILDGSRLYKILNRALAPTDIMNDDVDEFEECCLYIGKGKSNRNFQHAI